MDQIIDLIFENPFFLVLIIGALLSLFGDKKKGKQEEREQGQQQTSSRRRMPEPEGKPLGRMETTPERQPNLVQKKKEMSSQLSIEEHRANQMAEYLKRSSTNETSTDRDELSEDQVNKEQKRIQKLATSYKQNEFKKEFKKSLTKEGLVNSVIMSEVLGSPRSRNPYQSVITKRRAD